MTYIVTFHTHFDAMAFLRVVKPLGKAKMKPVPRYLSSSCGTCVFFTLQQEELLPEKLLHQSFESFYRISGSTPELIAEKE